MPKKSKLGPKNEVLFPEDVEWIDEKIPIPLSVSRQKSLPLDYDCADAKTAFTLRPTIKNAVSAHPALSGLHKVLGVYGRQPVQTGFAESTKFQQKTYTKRIECSYCGGPIDAGQPYRVTHLKKTYHALCFEYVLNPEDVRRRLPRIRR